VNWKTRSLVCSILVLACCVSAVSSPAHPHRVHGPPDFGSLPIAAPGQLSGRIIYLTWGGSCQWRSYDLSTGKDELLSDRLSCATVGPRLFSPDGKLILADVYRRGSSFGVQAEIVGQDGKAVSAGPTLGRANSPTGAYFANPAFSSDSRKITLCEYPRKHFLGLVADTATGKVVARVSDSCDLAFTQKGLAILRRGVLKLGGRVLARFPTASSPRLAATQAGSLLLITEHTKVRGTTNGRYTIVVMTLSGHVLGRYRDTLRDIPFSPIQLSPTGGSTHVWWGCIQQLAPLDPATHRFTLRFGTSGAGVSRPAYSPDGSYAAMAQDLPPVGPPTPLDAVVLDADTFRPLFRLPISARLVAWVPA
jgi:hypothetical protein